MIHQEEISKLIVISPSSFRANEHPLVHKMFEFGLKKYHLRKPDFSDSHWKEYIEGFEMKYRERLHIHHRPDLMELHKLGGVHYRYADLPSSYPNKTGSTSCSAHSWEEVQKLSADIDYAFVSPVFDSISKSLYKANSTLLSVPASPRTYELIALGGIEENNIQIALEAGYDGAAILGYIWEKEGLELERFERIQKKIELYESQITNQEL